MKNNNPVSKRINRIPRLARLICGQYNGAWIVGSAADPMNNDPKDYDIAVSFSDWQKVASLIPKDAKPTLFGGWKFLSDGMEVDVWPSEIINIFSCSKCEWMWQPNLNIRVKRLRK